VAVTTDRRYRNCGITFSAKSVMVSVDGESLQPGLDPVER
jgi:hypothetical protein